MKVQQFSQQGKRGNNEDSIGSNQGLFTVCDGMGGHNYGERASAFVKDSLLQAFQQPHSLGKMEIQQQLNQVQIGLNQLLEKEPELERMGTTFTGVFVTPDVWYAAHIGDSRIYLFRPSEQKMWHTWDHSFVGELMRTHEITTEAGRFHSMSNRISKALIAQKGGKPVSASIVKIDELKSGDIFLLCSDGVIEAWGDFELVQLFSDKSLSFEQKCERLQQQCDITSKDNNSAIIVEIEEKDAFSYGSNDELEWTTFMAVEEDYKQYCKDIMEDKEKEELVENKGVEEAITPTVERNMSANEEINIDNDYDGEDVGEEAGDDVGEAVSELLKEHVEASKRAVKFQKHWLVMMIILLVIIALFFLFKNYKIVNISTEEDNLPKTEVEELDIRPNENVNNEVQKEIKNVKKEDNVKKVVEGNVSQKAKTENVKDKPMEKIPGGNVQPVQSNQQSESGQNPTPKEENKQEEKQATQSNQNTGQVKESDKDVIQNSRSIINANQSNGSEKKEGKSDENN